MPPPRKRFQIHLSTAIVLMFVAGSLIWANVPIKATSITSANERCTYYLYGWPIRAKISHNVIMTHDIPIAIDVIFSVTLLFCVWFLCEHLIRRRAARKEP